MNNFMAGFCSELEKTAGIGGAAKYLLKRPLMTASLGMLVAGTAAAGSSAYKQGKGVGQRPKYLVGGTNPRTGGIGSSDEAHINYNQLFSKRQSKASRRALHGKYSPGKFKPA